MRSRGFILQPTYQIQRGRPVVHLYATLETGQSCVVRDNRQIPHFYIERADSRRALEAGAERVGPSARRTMEGQPVDRVDLSLPSETPPLRRRLQRAGISCYEADVRFAMRFLIDRGIRGSFEVSGEGQAAPNGVLFFDNPDLNPCEWRPRLSLLSLDIETDPRAEHILSAALVGCGTSEVLIVDTGKRPLPEDVSAWPDERSLLEALARRIRDLDPDVLTGWNLVDFDLRVLSRIAARERAPFTLGRNGDALRLRPSRSPWANHDASIAGRVVLDGIRLLRGSFVKIDDYSLEAVAEKILGRTKTIRGKDRGQTILATYKKDLPLFVEYNRNDSRLVLDILDRLNLIELSVERSLLTGLPIDRVASSIAAFDFLYLSELHGRGIVAPSVRSHQTSTANPGGHVLEPDPGLYENVLVLDFKSLYPSLIRTFQIDPLGYVGQQKGPDLIVAPNGAAFRQTPGILPGLLDRLFPRREEARRRGDQVASHAIKILMNSFYGVLGTPACRFYRPELAGAITTLGREVLLWTKGRAESEGFRVLYGDTDSLFVQSSEDDPDLALQEGVALTQRLNSALTAFLSVQWGVESRLELELERLFLKLHLPVMRHKRSGARKRYVGLVRSGTGTETVFTGMEVVRRDWTRLAKRVQRELYRRLFAGEETGTYLAELVAALRGGELDDLLVYRKGLRKKVESYTSTTPPHVVAARKSRATPDRIIAYLMTTQGPEPASESTSPLDYEHYVQRQVRPVAEPLLALSGLDFDKVIGDDRQLELFT